MKRGDVMRYGIFALVLLTALTLIALAAQEPLTVLIVANSPFTKVETGRGFALLTALALIVYVPLLAFLASQSVTKSDYIQELKWLAKKSITTDRAAADLQELEIAVDATWGMLAGHASNSKIRNKLGALDLVDKANDAEVDLARFRRITAQLKILTTT